MHRDDRRFLSNPESLSRWRPCAAFACGLLIFLTQIFDAGSVKADSLDMTESSSSPPWFSGTLLSTWGRTIDRGHMVTQSYVYLTRFGGLYNDNWLLQSASAFHTTIQRTYFLYGLTNQMDLEVAPQWLANRSQGESASGFGDLPVSLGFQLIRDREEWWFPDLRLWIQEVFPIGGRYTNLDPKRASVETTGVAPLPP
jgi:hypothetical protein